MRILKTIMLVIATTYCSLSFAQSSDTVYYEILRNNPKDINNLYIYASPFGFDISASYMNLSYGFGAEYNYRDKFTLGFNLRRSYTEKINDEIMGPMIQPLKQGTAKGGNKNFAFYELSAQVLLGGRQVVHNERSTMEADMYSKTYIKVKVKHFIALALRASYGYHHYPLYSNFSGHKTNDFSPVEGIGGATMNNLQFASFGLGLFQKQDIKLKTDKYGDKDYSTITTYYFDMLFPIYQDLTNMEVTDNTSATPMYYEVDVDYTPMSTYGYRVGVKYQVVSRIRKINGGIRFELGFLPGLNKFPKNFYMSAGIEINISFDAQ